MIRAVGSSVGTARFCCGERSGAEPSSRFGLRMSPDITARIGLRSRAGRAGFFLNDAAAELEIPVRVGGGESLILPHDWCCDPAAFRLRAGTLFGECSCWTCSCRLS